MEQGVIDSAIDEWRRHKRAYVWAKWDISSKRYQNINNLLNSNVSTCISLKLCKICVILKSWICGSCRFFQTSWSKYVMQLLFYIQFPFQQWKNFENLPRFDKVIAKVRQHPFFWDTVYIQLIKFYILPRLLRRRSYAIKLNQNYHAVGFLCVAKKGCFKT